MWAQSGRCVHAGCPQAACEAGSTQRWCRTMKKLGAEAVPAVMTEQQQCCELPWPCASGSRSLLQMPAAPTYLHQSEGGVPQGCGADSVHCRGVWGSSVGGCAASVGRAASAGVHASQQEVWLQHCCCTVRGKTGHTWSCLLTRQQQC
jgi:hypothetical protein